MPLNLGSAIKYGFQKVLGTTYATDIDAGFGAVVDQTIAALDLVIPAGTILATGRTTAPTGYLMCQGALVSRTTYAALFAAIGTVYGNGDGSTTFGLPDLRGRAPVGSDATHNQLSANSALGNTGGAETVTLTASQIPAHAHELRQQTGIGGGIAIGVSGASGRVSQGGGDPITNGTPFTENAGGGGAHTNLPPYQIVNFMIRTGL